MKHPDQTDLLALIDGEMPSARRTLVQAHLSQCDACRAECDALHDDFTRLVSVLQQEEPDRRVVLEMRQSLLERVQDWKSGKRPLADEVGEFLGESGRDLVVRLEREGRSRADILAALDPLFITFLGRKAASRLREHLQSAN